MSSFAKGPALWPRARGERWDFQAVLLRRDVGAVHAERLLDRGPSFGHDIAVATFEDRMTLDANGQGLGVGETDAVKAGRSSLSIAIIQRGAVLSNEHGNTPEIWENL